MTTLKEEIYNYISDGRHYDEYDDPLEITNEILELIKKQIDQVQEDYHNELNDWGKQQPMEDMWPKQMDALNKVRKKFGIETKK